jgi:hypothetical protein
LRISSDDCVALAERALVGILRKEGYPLAMPLATEFDPRDGLSATLCTLVHQTATSPRYKEPVAERRPALELAETLVSRFQELQVVGDHWKP